MHYNEEYFESGLYRVGTRCEKWDLMREENHDDTMIPLWVADMDFPSPPEVCAALVNRAAHPTYGYTEPAHDDYQAAMDYWQRRHGLTFAEEDIILLPCVVTGLKLAIQACTNPGDGVVIMSPVYGPFSHSVEATDRKEVDCPLTKDASGRYSMDLAAIEKALQSGAKAVMLCNPHNPVSRAWSKEELLALAEVTKRYHATLISDEIHADFVYAPLTFVPMLSLMQENVISLCAASKTFNLAGLQQAMCLCKDKALRTKFQTALEAAGVRSGNIFALEANRAAYQYGDAWLDGLLNYLSGSRQLLTDWVHENLPEAVITPIEATYLAWLDLSAYGHTTEELMEMTKAEGVYFTAGTFFGEKAGEYHLRVNFGTPRHILMEGLARLEKALKK
jgi:cysteine-S-conjugate beta-lyase